MAARPARRHRRRAALTSEPAARPPARHPAAAGWPGSSYTGADGRPVRDADALDRIRRLVVPPASRPTWPGRAWHTTASATRRTRGRTTRSG
ncbi:MAG: hypothetical protein E6J41_29800 [Chloroflexi bacterium]|nr:MAG: hypothetical protein E6J41_29800 [Chloroflexota bacterium]